MMPRMLWELLLRGKTRLLKILLVILTSVLIILTPILLTRDYRLCLHNVFSTISKQFVNPGLGAGVHALPLGEAVGGGGEAAGEEAAGGALGLAPRLTSRCR